MSVLPFFLLSASMESARPAESPNPIRIFKSTSCDDETNCIAPKDIFYDYDHVIACLGDSEYHKPEVIPVEEDDDASETMDEGPSPVDIDTESPEEYLDETFDTDLDEEYQENSHARRPLSTAASPASSSTFSRTRRTIPVLRKIHRKTSTHITESDNPQRCTYVDPQDGTRCTKINRSLQEAARHWRSCHLYKEAKAMLTGAIPVGEGTAIKSRKKLEEVRPLIQCPYCDALITRSDAMRRHINTNCKQGTA